MTNNDVIIRHYAVESAKSEPECITALFRSRQYSFNDDFELTAAEIERDDLYLDGDIIYKCLVSSIDLTLEVQHDPPALRIVDSAGNLFGEMSITRDDFNFLKVARKTSKFLGGPGKRVIEKDDGSIRLTKEEFYPWTIYITGRARRKRK